MTTAKKTVLIVSTIIGAVFLFNFGTYVGKGFYKQVQAHNGTTGSIQNVLSKHCKCDAQFEFSSFGIHWSKKDGINGETAEFNLKNYNAETSVTDEALRLNSILKNKVTNYDEIDVLTLNFISEENIETVKFKNGSILN
ncbi:MAG: hypothetical protein ACSHW7_03745 [Patiriisocius sp.]|uniref:hypothetical protein n=1 Tax=Patiriisocius sp. TaxID=2822396 RepID=UPI003EF5B064